MILSAAAKTKDFTASFSCASNQNMVLPLSIHTVVEWRSLTFFYLSDKDKDILKFWKANIKYVKKTVYLHKKKCSLASKNSNSVFFQPMSITKQLLEEDWAQVLLTNIMSLNNFFLYNGKKQKNSGKSL